ncbi:hypothetical protein NHX12_032237 [Muraenolepis orangiensis]|uniref:Uncharacterized protein n=1 Tax=Muraenolepis orangiensis TaxID=630683 RepID=A0A9Q0E5C2_9TELE|nr:hypothetical protein NHX12_032237 [Muraenolepis orangiensis]
MFLAVGAATRPRSLVSLHLRGMSRHDRAVLIQVVRQSGEDAGAVGQGPRPPATTGSNGTALTAANLTSGSHQA